MLFALNKPSILVQYYIKPTHIVSVRSRDVICPIVSEKYLTTTFMLQTKKEWRSKEKPPV